MKRKEFREYLEGNLKYLPNKHPESQMFHIKNQKDIWFYIINKWQGENKDVAKVLFQDELTMNLTGDREEDILTMVNNIFCLTKYIKRKRWYYNS